MVWGEYFCWRDHYLTTYHELLQKSCCFEIFFLIRIFPRLHMEVSVVVSLVLRFYKKFWADLRFSSVLMKCFIFLSSVYLGIKFRNWCSLFSLPIILKKFLKQSSVSNFCSFQFFTQHFSFTLHFKLLV